MIDTRRRRIRNNKGSSSSRRDVGQQHHHHHHHHQLPYYCHHTKRNPSLASIPENDLSSAEEDNDNDNATVSYPYSLHQEQEERKEEEEGHLALLTGSPTSVRGCCIQLEDLLLAAPDSLPFLKASGGSKTAGSCPHRQQLQLVNRERSKRGLDPLSPSAMLEQLALRQAQWQARANRVFHSASSIEELMLLLSSVTVAENVQRGDFHSSVREMHSQTMQHRGTVNRANILSRHFREFGAAAVQGQDGKLYVCQLFRG